MIVDFHSQVVKQTQKQEIGKGKFNIVKKETKSELDKCKGREMKVPWLHLLSLKNTGSDLWELQFITDHIKTEALRDDENNALPHGPVHMMYQQMIAINMTYH